jgi:hypothetical protein
MALVLRQLTHFLSIVTKTALRRLPLAVARRGSLNTTQGFRTLFFAERLELFS